MPPHRFYRGKLLDKELRSIFEDRGRLPNLTRLEHEYHRRTTRILIGLVLFFGVLTAASWGGFLLFSNSSGGGADVELSFSAPQLVVSGIPQELTIRYKNLDRNPLAFGKLLLRLPNNLLLKEVIAPPPTEKEHLQWDFGTLPAKASGEIKLRVIPFGLLDEILEPQAIFTYKPANFNAEFQVTKTHIFTIRAAPLNIVSEGPEIISTGEEALLRFKLRNETDETFNTLKVTLKPPPGFLLRETVPLSSELTWTIATLSPSVEQEFAIRGAFMSETQGRAEFILEVQKQGEGERLYPLTQAVSALEVQGGALTVNLGINLNPPPSWVRLGSKLPLVVKLRNTTKDPFKDIQLELNLRGTLIDWKKTQTETGTIKDGVVQFPKDGLLTLAPEATQEYALALQVAETAPSPSTSPFIESVAEVSFGDTHIQTAPLKIIVVSDLTLSTEARYFGADGKPVGSGPLPPRVGEKTRFNVRLRLHNTFHDLANIAVIATLPEKVTWGNTFSAQAGNLAFEPKTREVRWQIPRMVITNPELTAQFEVEVTPIEKDRGNLLLLLGVARVEALDTISQVSFSADAPSLSSSLDTDPHARGKGVVQ